MWRNKDNLKIDKESMTVKENNSLQENKILVILTN
jgi:hypothetical protein